MKNFEKIVPAVALGVAMVGLGTADAHALETPAPATENENGTQEVTTTSGTAMDTQMKSLVRTAAASTESTSTEANNAEETDIIDNATPAAGAPKAKAAKETVTVENYGANLGAGNGIDNVVKFNGELEVTTTKTSVTNEKTGEEANYEDVDIKGGIKGEEPGTPFEEDGKKVGDAVDDSTGKDEDGNVTFDKGNFQTTIEQVFGDDFKSDSWKDDTKDGLGTITFETNKTVPKDLTDAEKDTFLKDVKGITKGDDGKYRNADGQVVNVAWGTGSTVTNTTTWTITIEKEEAGKQDDTVSDVSGSGSTVVKPDNSDSEDTLNAKDVLDGIKVNENGDVTFKGQEVQYVTRDTETGRVTSFQVGQFGDVGSTQTTYNITYRQDTGSIDALLGELNVVPSTSEEFFKLLPPELGFTLTSDGKILDKTGSKVIINWTGAPTYSYWDVEVKMTTKTLTELGTDSKPSTPDQIIPPSPEEIQGALTEAESSAKAEAEEKAKEDALLVANTAELKNQAILDAVTKAVTSDGTKLTDAQIAKIREAVERSEPNAEGVYSVVVGDTTYTVTVNVTIGDANITGETTGSSDSSKIEEGENAGTVIVIGTGNATASVTVTATVGIDISKTVDVDLDNRYQDGSEDSLGDKNFTPEYLEGLKENDLFDGGEVLEVSSKDGVYEIITEKKVTRDDGVTVTTTTTYNITVTTETHYKETDKAQKYEDAKFDAHFKDGTWTFDIGEAKSFVLKQNNQAYLYYDAAVYDTPEKVKALEAAIRAVDSSLGNKTINPFTFDFTSSEDHWLGTASNEQTRFNFVDGIVTVYSKKSDKADGLSHFITGPQIEETTTTTVDGKYSWEYKGSKDEVSNYNADGIAEANGKGDGSAQEELKPEIIRGDPAIPGEEAKYNEEKQYGSAYLVDWQYNGSLNYTYRTPGGIKVSFEGETSADRILDAKVTITPVTPTTPNRPTTPDEPTTDIPDEEPPLVDVPDEPGPDPDTPVVDIPDEEPPLVDVPDEDTPLVNVPETPTVTIPAEDVPLVKAPAPTPNTVEILEEEVPLADVPETGEAPTSLLAAAAACFSALGLGILKKRKED